MKYIAIFEEEKKGISVTFPDVPGCVTFGKTLDEAVDMAHEALSMFVELELEAGADLPDARDKKEISALPEAKGNKLIGIDVAEDGTDFEEVAVVLHKHLLERIEKYADSYGVGPADFLAVAAREAMRNDVFKE